MLRARMAEVLAAAGPAMTAEEYRRHAAPLAGAGEGGGPLDAGELRPAGVYRQPYQPEADRYGGADLLARSEALFHQASQLALGVPPARSARSRPVGPRPAGHPGGARHPGRRRPTPAVLPVGGGGLAGLGGQVRRGESPAPRPWAGWRAGPGAGPAVGRPAGPGNDDLAGREGHGGGERILHAHIHMLHNRLGLSVVQERNHYLALADISAPGRGRAQAAP